MQGNKVVPDALPLLEQTGWAGLPEDEDQRDSWYADALRYRRIHVLLKREGWKVNHKLVYRPYKEEGLMLHCKKQQGKHVESAADDRNQEVQQMLGDGLRIGPAVQRQEAKGAYSDRSM